MFQSDNLEKNCIVIASSDFFLYMNSHDKVMTSEISLSKDLIDLKGRNNYHVHVSVLRSYLLVLVCLLKRTSLELQTLPLFFFPKFEAPNWGCGLYMDFYGILTLESG